MREKVDMEGFYGRLPFSLTGAQRRAAGEITADLLGKTPMNRLIQGDVGSGKTAVAAAAVFFAFKNGYQSAMMVPTSVLAEQQFASLSGLLSPLGIGCGLLTGIWGRAEEEGSGGAFIRGDRFCDRHPRAA
jgi:ATP-dependent DNA helicase RecG